MNRELVFFLEEASAKALLEGLLPRMFPNGFAWRYIVFEGKQDLAKQIVRRLRGYQNPHAKFIVLQDQDANPDCRNVKARLQSLCAEAGRPETTVRIACRELETFYLADLAAVEAGLSLKGLAKLQAKESFRNPDRLHSPSTELSRLTGGHYQKVGGSRSIAPHLDLANDRSPSFQALIRVIRRLTEIR